MIDLLRTQKFMAWKRDYFFRLLLLHELHKLCLEDLHRHIAIALLRAFTLARRRKTRRNMDDAHGCFALVHILPARSG